MGSGASVEEPKEDPNLKKLEENLKKLEELEKRIDMINERNESTAKSGELEKKLDILIEKSEFAAKRTDSIPSDSGILGRVLGYDPDVKTRKRSLLEEIRNNPWRYD